MSTAKENPLSRDPQVNEQFLLTDPEQLRMIVKALTIQMEAMLDAPEQLSRSGVRRGIELQVMFLHAVCCDDCGECRARDHIEPDDFHRESLKSLFKMLRDVAEMDGAATVQSAIDEALARVFGGRVDASRMN